MLKMVVRMEAITGGANFKCSLVRWSWPAAFSESKEEMTLATSSSVIRSGSEWGVASSSREISELQSGDMVESWWSGEPSDLKYLAQPSMMSVPS